MDLVKRVFAAFTVSPVSVVAVTTTVGFIYWDSSRTYRERKAAYEETAEKARIAKELVRQQAEMKGN